jgi:hypothetical protein
MYTAKAANSFSCEGIAARSCLLSQDGKSSSVVCEPDAGRSATMTVAGAK